MEIELAIFHSEFILRKLKGLVNQIDVLVLHQLQFDLVTLNKNFTSVSSGLPERRCKYMT